MEKLTKENYYSYPALSNSMMSWLLPENGGSMKKFEDKMLFPQEEGDSASMRLGTLIHKYVEQKTYDVFQICDVPSPAIAKICESIAEDGITDLDSQILSTARALDFQPGWKDQTVIDKIKEQGSAYLANIMDAKSKNKSLVTESEMNLIKKIGDNICEVIPWNFSTSPDVPSDISPRFEKSSPFPSVIYNEKAINFVLDGIECKGLIDIAIINPIDDSVTIIDLKTTSTPLSLFEGYKMHEITKEGIRENQVEGIMYKRQVHRQLAFYGMGLATLNYRVSNYFVLVAETEAPYEVKLVRVPDNYIELGTIRIRQALDLIIHNSLMKTGL